MFVGPFKGWSVYYQNRSQATFDTVAKNLDEVKRQELLKLANNLPQESLIFGICDKSRIMLLDGTHRSVAITLARQYRLDIHPIVQMALAHFSKDQQKRFDQIFDTIVKVPTPIS